MQMCTASATKWQNVFTTNFVNVSERRLKFQVVPQMFRWSHLHFHGSMGLLPGILFNLIFLSDSVILLTIVFLCISSSYFRVCCLTSPSLVRTTTWHSPVLLFLCFPVQCGVSAVCCCGRTQVGNWQRKQMMIYFVSVLFLYVCACVRAEVTVAHADKGPAEIVMKCYWLTVLYLVPLCSLVFKAVPLALKSTLHGRTLK